MSRSDTFVAPATAWFPGRLVGGTALVLGPLIWCAGLVTRFLSVRAAVFTQQQEQRLAGQMFAGPRQLAAYVQHPGPVTAGYALFAGGAVVLCFAVIALARLAATGSPRLALAGGVLVLMSLLSRLYWAGVDQTAFALVDRLGLEQATKTVMDMYTQVSYGPWRIPIAMAFGLYIGTPLLGVAAFRAEVFGTGRLVLFLPSTMLWSGVLKASTWDGLVSSALLCLVLAPLGIQLLRGRAPQPGTTGTRWLSW